MLFRHVWSDETLDLAQIFGSSILTHVSKGYCVDSSIMLRMLRYITSSCSCVLIHVASVKLMSGTF